MFSRLGLISRFSIDEAVLRNFISDVQKNYKRVPYHNFTHAFNICHMCYYILRTTKVRDYLEDIDILAIMIGSLGHDIDHPGVNNLYLQKTRHVFSTTVNDSSILENYHLYMLFKLLTTQKNNILAGLTSAE